MQRRHRLAHLLSRGVVAAVSQGMMLSGLYPLLPHAYRAWQARAAGAAPAASRADRPGTGGVKAAVIEWAVAALLSAARPLGFAALPGARGAGPRPIILVHGYAMSRAGFLLLAHRLAAAGLGPVYGFEYWSLGRTAVAARQLGWFVDQVRAATGAAEVDLVGHSMGGVVARYYVALAGGDPHVAHLITLGSPHAGTDVSRMGVGHASRELVLGSSFVARLAAAPAPLHATITRIGSRADALVPHAQQPLLAGAEDLVFDDLGHVALMASRRVAAAVIARLRR